jgi:putative ABC transport system permease protein
VLDLRGVSALVRIARREVRRHPRRSALVVVLIALPVAVVACGLATQATLEPTEAELRSQESGRADIVVGTPNPDRGSPAPQSPAAAERALRDVLRDGSGVVPDRRARLDVSSADLATGAVVIATDAPHPVNDGRFHVSEGRLPLRPGEATVSPGVAHELDVGVGDVVTLHPAETRLEVVGLAQAAGALLDWTVIVPHGTIPTTAWLVDLAPGADVEAILTRLRASPALRGIEVRSAGAALEASGVRPLPGLDPTWFMIGSLALVWTGVVAAAAFAIGARSRLREVGLVAATGGTQRQVRRLLLADGLVLGLLGSLLGLIAGLALAVPVVDHLARDADRLPGPLRAPWPAELGAVALGTSGAILAARWPAVRAARLPTLAALQSRITRPPRRARATAGGVVTIGAGGAVLAYGASADAELPIVAGTLLVVAGVAMLHRLLVDLVARLADRAPLSLRFAARDASRQASRTGPAVVASMLALAAAIGAATITSTAAARDAANPQHRDYPPQRLEVGVGGADGTALQVSPGHDVAALERALGESLDARRMGTIWSATTPAQAGAATGPDPPDRPATVQIAAPEALAVLGVTDTPTLEAFAHGSALRIERQAVPSPAAITAADGTEQQVPVVDVRTGTVGVLGTLAVPPDVAGRLGLTHVTQLAVILDLGRPVREHDLARAHATALRTLGPGSQIWTATQDGQCCNKRLITLAVLAFGLAIALPVLGLVAALTRSEAQTELAVLDAVGIAPRRRRRFAAAGMGLLAAFATALALPAGLIPAALYLRADSPRIPGGSVISVPTAAIAMLMVGVPLALAAIGWLTAGTGACARTVNERLTAHLVNVRLTAWWTSASISSSTSSKTATTPRSIASRRQPC